MLKSALQDTQWVRWLRPLLLASLGLHALVLSLPIPEQTEPAVPVSTAEPLPASIQVGTLPETPSPVSAPPKPNTAVQQPAPTPVTTSPVVAPVPDMPPEKRAAVEQEPLSDPLPVEPPPLEAAPAPGVSEAAAPSAETPFAYNSAGTSQSDANAALQAWFNRVQVNYALAQNFADLLADSMRTDPIRITPSPQCRPTEPSRKASIGVVAGNNGVPLEDPETLGSTGYQDLDEAAIAQAKTRHYPTADQPKAFSLRVRVDYDATACVPPNS